MKKAILFTFILTLTAITAFAVPLEALVSLPHARQLRAGGPDGGLIIETYLRNPVLRMTPRNSDLQRFVDQAMTSLNPNMMAEILYLYRKPEGYQTSSTSWDNEQRIKVFNEVPAISTMTGLDYFSASRGAMRVFYEYSSVVDGPTTRVPIPDPVFEQPPANLTLFARQRDLSFGDNIYRYDYVTTPDAIFFTQENLTTMHFGIIPAIQRGNLRSIIAIIDCGDSILIYAVIMTKAFSVPGMWNRFSASFSNRAEAVIKWYTDRLDTQVFVK